MQDLNEFLQQNFISKLYHPLLFQIKLLHSACRTEKITSQAYHGTTTNWQLINCLKKEKNMKINIFQQGDSIEFLHNLIEEINKELNGKTKNRNWRNVPDFDKLLLSQKYEMNMCTVCNQESLVDLSDLTLELITTNQLKIIDTVSGALKLSLNEKTQNIPCSYCKKNTKTISNYSQQLPKYLWLKISRNRFNQRTKKLERTNHRITPEKNIITSDAKSKSRKAYTLTGGIIHNGGANSGHYTYITYQNNDWFIISDDKVD
jgi:ubiquitin C-terminal hydrolase